MSNEEVQTTSNEPLYDADALKRVYGRYPSSGQEVMKGAKLMWLIVKSEGTGAVEALFRAMNELGMAKTAVELLREFINTPEAYHTTMEDCLPLDTKQSITHARRLLHAAFQAALADGVVGPSERSFIDSLARRLRVQPAMVSLIESLVQAESNVQKIRLAVFADNLTLE